MIKQEKWSCQDAIKGRTTARNTPSVQARSDMNKCDFSDANYFFKQKYWLVQTLLHNLVQPDAAPDAPSAFLRFGTLSEPGNSHFGSLYTQLNWSVYNHLTYLQTSESTGAFIMWRNPVPRDMP